MNSNYIQEKLWSNYCNNKYNLSNAFVFKWESDFLTMTSSKYFIEIEIKTSKNDFKNDFKKTFVVNREPKYKHDLLNDSNYVLRPNKFFFCIPKVISKS